MFICICVCSFIPINCIINPAIEIFIDSFSRGRKVDLNPPYLTEIVTKTYRLQFTT